MYGLHDEESFRLVADRPLALQVDGDYVGERTGVTFTSEPEALRVVV
jgi:diacylglycerol kinase family enzyme